MTYPTLRERVRDALLDAKFKALEDTLPTRSSQGTFFLKPGVGVEVHVEWWDVDSLEKRALLLRFAAALADAGFIVEDRGYRVYVVEPGKSGSDGDELGRAPVKGCARPHVC